MDQIKKNGFWIACGVLSLAMIGTWWWGTSSVRTAQLGNESQIELAAKGAQEVKAKTFEGAPSGTVVHPTAASEAGMKKQIDAAIRKMFEAWELRRTAQEGILKWPEEVLKSSEFAQKFSKYDPPQKFDLKNADGSEVIPPMPNLLLIYKELIPKRMENIAAIIKTRWDYAELPPVAQNAEGKNRPIAQVASDKNLSVIVRWNEENQKLWYEKLTKFNNLDGNLAKDEVPLPRQAFALQEDLWLLEAFFNIVKKVNGDAQTNEMAAVKEIDHVVFGRDSYQTQIGKISTPNPQLLSGRILTSAGGEEQDPLQKGPPGRDEDADPNPSAGSGGAASMAFSFELDGESNLLAPFHGRYVNTNFEPLSIDNILTVFKTPELVDVNVEAIVAKRIPFRIAVRVSESKIPDLISGFSNSEFAFEVFQVRVNRDDAYSPIERRGKNKAGKEDKNRPSVGIGGGGAGNSVDGGGSEPASGSGGAAAETVVTKNNIEIRRKDDVKVEFYGIVKIYNPVDWSKFKSLLEQSPDGSTPPASAQNAASLPPKS